MAFQCCCCGPPGWLRGPVGRGAATPLRRGLGPYTDPLKRQSQTISHEVAENGK